MKFYYLDFMIKEQSLIRVKTYEDLIMRDNDKLKGCNYDKEYERCDKKCI